MLVSGQRAEYCWDFGIVTLISQQLLSCKHSSPSPSDWSNKACRWGEESQGIWAERGTMGRICVGNLPPRHKGSLASGTE